MPKRTEPVIETPQGVSAEHMMLQDVDTSSGPLFSVGVVGKVFFDKSDHTLRRWERMNYFFLDGKEVGTMRSGSAGNRRTYSLSDIELMAHALTQHNVINGERLALVIQALVAVARVHGYLEIAE